MGRKLMDEHTAYWGPPTVSGVTGSMFGTCGAQGA